MNESLFSFRNALKIVGFALLTIMVAVIAVNSLRISKENERIQANQLETLTKILISQASLSASEMIEQEDQERLLALTNQLAQDRLVFDATVYDAEGIKLAASDDALSAREVLGLDTPLATARIGRQQLVEPVINDGSIVGFVRITFETGRVTAVSDHFYRKSDRYMYGLIALSFLCGLLMVILLKRKPKKKGENLLLKGL
ncbi:YtjB family periplasmic protein [Vibrio astriarenae]|jgi:membrane protein|uniref:YtjB family periplasmic protein n=1 Tax=Vibrio agarivorans TaxID=153622 RepID=A0ABT7XX87_9VIBR|nr:YtjB family periplasmic protein [Vibrio agarivorans]MDN2480387.1 YtjB family periplasmic protein [Vibrio agarivorans]MDN3662593.1 YtjB family periplasmic protein [Vibrio agarivorans]